MSCRLLFIILLACAMSCSSSAYARRYKIALIHSYQENYTQAPLINDLLQKGLKHNGIEFEIKEYFLDCERYESVEEEARISGFINNIHRWEADLIAVLDDQATYSVMACKNPHIKGMPIVFSGVNYPNNKLLSELPNITGYADRPDYFTTCKMIESIMGKVRINLLTGTTVLDRMIWDDLTKQCAGKDIKIKEWERTEGLTINKSIPISDKNDAPESLIKKLNKHSQIDTTTIVKITSDNVFARDLLWLASGVFKYSLYLYTKRDYTTLRIGSLFDNPGFETTNEGFGEKEDMLGGYFATIETQMKDMATGIAERLHGKMPEQQIQYCTKEYVVNWKVLNKYNIPLSSIPKEYTIMYVPITVKYRTHLIVLITIATLLLIFAVSYLIYMYMRERKHKLSALDKLKYEHESLTLAIEGGQTYAWTYNGSHVTFDAQFYDFCKHPYAPISLREFTHFIHPDDQIAFFHNASDIVIRPRRAAEYRCNFNNSEYEWWEFRYSVIHNDENAPIVAGLLLNIQDVKDKEEELIRARELAERAELKQSFLTNMSHEIRTPLNAIVGFSNLLTSDDELSNEEKQEFVTIINNNTNLLLKLVNDVLELSRIESGNMSFSYKDCYVKQLLEEVYQTHQVIINPPVEFLKEFPEEEILVHIDPMRMTQVITNFLGNANKFTNEGYIKLGYYCVKERKEVHIYVEDTGAGIPAEEVNMIFERFYKRNEFAQGVGLGLSICKVIVGKLNGHIEVTSEVDKGSRFTVVLPYL